MAVSVNTCQPTEVRTSWLSTVTYVPCRDIDGKLHFAPVAAGTSKADVVLGTIQAGAIAGAGVAIGQGLRAAELGATVDLGGAIP